MKQQDIVIEFETSETEIEFTESKVEIEIEPGGSSGQPYDGNYEVVPTANFQLLPTAEKVLEDDILVHPIPYSEVSNKYGGYTVTIGG